MQTTPLIAKPWLRVIFFLVVSLIATTILINLIETLVYKGWFGFSTKTWPAEIATAFSYSMQQLITIAAVFFTLKYIDAKPFAATGLYNGSVNNIALGAFVALAILLLGFFWHTVENYVVVLGTQFKPTAFFSSLILFALVALAEEIMLRGYILNNLMQSMNKWLALLISAIIFSIFHVGNPNINAVAIINIFLAGILLGINYIYTKSLWFAIALHFVWNFVQGSVLGYSVSGLLPNNGILLLQTNGGSLFTGGAFGFEGSIVSTILQTVAIALLLVYFEKKYKPQKNNLL
jgi:uncharacterized protein